MLLAGRDSKPLDSSRPLGQTSVSSVFAACERSTIQIVEVTLFCFWLRRQSNHCMMQSFNPVQGFVPSLQGGPDLGGERSVSLQQYGMGKMRNIDREMPQWEASYPCHLMIPILVGSATYLLSRLAWFTGTKCVWRLSDWFWGDPAPNLPRRTWRATYCAALKMASSCNLAHMWWVECRTQILMILEYCDASCNGACSVSTLGFNFWV